MLLSVTEIELAIIIVLFSVFLLRDITNTNSNPTPNTSTITISGKENKVW